MTEGPLPTDVLTAIDDAARFLSVSGAPAATQCATGHATEMGGPSCIALAVDGIAPMPYVPALMPAQHDYAVLLRPPRLYSRREVLIRPSPVPPRPGVYAWYFREVPPGVPVHGCNRHDGLALLYVGISPSKPPSNGKSPSKQSLAARIRYHFAGNAEGSTLRLTLGCLLSDQLGIRLTGEQRQYGKLAEGAEAGYYDPE